MLVGAIVRVVLGPTRHRTGDVWQLPCVETKSCYLEKTLRGTKQLHVLKSIYPAILLTGD